jgi:hypothetical protein
MSPARTAGLFYCVRVLYTVAIPFPEFLMDTGPTATEKLKNVLKYLLLLSAILFSAAGQNKQTSEVQFDGRTGYAEVPYDSTFESFRHVHL